MGGIAGIFHPDVPKPVDPVRVRAMSEALAHRGPDGGGAWTGPGIGLGHRRLAVIDHAGGGQPLLSADERLAIVFDGEIHNFRELRIELEAKGHIFRSDGDTEVILAAWRQWGVACLAHLHGMFAFAIYDAETKSLFLARDRLGMKPLFHATLADGAFVFASELKGLLAHPLMRGTPDPRAVEDYLALGYVPDDVSLVAGVRKLAAGHYLLVERGRPVPQPVGWWDIDFTRTSRSSAAALEEELVALMRAAVRSRMAADVPLGAFLSGGIEDAGVVALMAEASRSAIETFFIGFSPTGNDVRTARRVAERFVTRHHEAVVLSDESGLLDRIAIAFDEPFADPAALASLRLAERARESMTVALSGVGADEVFAGHRRYRAMVIEDRMRRLLPDMGRKAISRLGDVWPGLQPLARTTGEGYVTAIAIMPATLRARLYRDGFRTALQGHRFEERFVRSMAASPVADQLSRAQYADLKIALPANRLTRLDRTAMAVGLETRAPWLDHRLAEFAARLPASMRLRAGRAGTGQWLMRRALRRYLPGDLLERNGGGPSVPVGAGFRGVLADGVERGTALAELGWLDGKVIAAFADEHRSGRADHGPLLWQLLILEKSLQRLFGLGSSSPSYSAAAK